MLTLEEALALVARASDAIESAVLQHVEAEALAEGFSPPAVRFVIEEYRRVLVATRGRRLETAKQMLEAHATSLQ